MRQLLLTAAAIALAAPAFAATIDLSATLRDFSDAHPDFQEGSSGVVTGLVSTSLNALGNPDFVAAPGTGKISSVASFDQWYNDVPGVNVTYPLTLTLTEGPGGIYTFSSGSFFPLDAISPPAAFEGRIHNYHFTLELGTSFTYVPGQVFSFTGDDDLWVYINDELVIDIGGVHGAASDSVDLDTLGLTAGETYSFDLFFAERQTVLSSFSIATSIVFEEAPAPATLALFGLGIAGIGLARRRAR